MSRLSKIISETLEKKKLFEDEEEAPIEDEEESFDGEEEAPVDGAEEANAEAGVEETEETEETEEPEEPEEDYEDIDKTIEQMIGITEIQHTSSSTIIDFEDGGQVMYVHPIVSIKSETLNKMIGLIIEDVKHTYSVSKDEITGKSIEKTKYWKSINTLIETMVRSQLTKSDNVNGLIDEIKQIFKVLEVK